MSKYDFKSLLEEYNVVIPLIQRDYAQGRLNNRTIELRKQLLNDIHEVLIDKNINSLDLNFIYGKSNEYEFVPLDGQQRLTTLYLVYLYSYRNIENCSFLENFSYKTRNSSKVFLKKIYDNRKIVFNETKISSYVKDAPWYADSWKFDPTIQGALTTIDDISEIFDKNLDYTAVLDNKNEPRILFNFLDIDKLGSEDDLYIKLNSRGKLLSDFENFKAKFISRVCELLSNKETEVIENKFDSSWTDCIWRINKNKFDENFLNFFEILLTNYIPSLSYANRKNWSTSLNFKDIDLSILETMIKTLDYISGNNPSNHEISKKIKECIVSKSLKDRVYFHVLTIFITSNESENSEVFTEWYRIFTNLIENTEIDSINPYERAIKGIDSQKDRIRYIMKDLANGHRVTGFNLEQQEEEIEKAKLLLSNCVGKEYILLAEKHPYFRGQIRSSFYFKSDLENEKKLEIIQKYWTKILKIFDSNGPIEDWLLRSALLTIGDYTIPVESYKTLCQNDPKESSSTPSLKRLFARRGNILKEFLDEIDTTRNIKEIYEEIIDKNIDKIDSEDWKYAFVKNYEAMFSNMSSQQYRIKSPGYGRESEMLLIRNKNSRGKNIDIHLLALKEELKKVDIYSEYSSEAGLMTDERYLFIDDFIVQFRADRYVFQNTSLKNGKLLELNENPASFEEMAKYIKNKMN